MSPVNLIVYSDYLCPWCYNAAVRLRRLEGELGADLHLEWRSFLLRPRPDPGRTLEALSLSEQLPEPPGRLTQPMQPAGFEALAGVPLGRPARPTPSLAVVPPSRGAVGETPAVREARLARERATAERAREQAEAEEERARLEAVRQAETAVNQARADEARAREAWENAKGRLRDAERELERLRETKGRRHPSKKS